MKSILSETEINEMKARQRGYELTDARRRARKAGTEAGSPSAKAKSRAKPATKSAQVKAAPAVEIAAAAPAGPYGLVVNEGLTIMFRVVAFNGDTALGKLVLGSGREPPAGAPLSCFNIKARNVTLFETLEDALAYAEREGIKIVGTGTGDELKAEIKGVLADHTLRSLATK